MLNNFSQVTALVNCKAWNLRAFLIAEPNDNVIVKCMMNNDDKSDIELSLVGVNRQMSHGDQNDNILLKRP